MIAFRHHALCIAALAFMFVSPFDIVTQAHGNPQMSTEDQQKTEARNRTLVEQAFEKWANGTGGPYDLLAEDVSWTIVGHSDASRTYDSRADFIGEVIAPFNARMSQGLRPTIRELYVQGDRVVIFFDAGGVARDGIAYANTYAWFWKMRDGEVVVAYAFFDSIAFNDFWRRVSPAE